MPDGHAEAAAVLLGAAHSLRRTTLSGHPPPEHDGVEDTIAHVRQQLGDDDYESGFRRGRTMDVDAVVALARRPRR